MVLSAELHYRLGHLVKHTKVLIYLSNDNDLRVTMVSGVARYFTRLLICCHFYSSTMRERLLYN